jgi:sugar phosphate isomerase/epimerase
MSSAELSRRTSITTDMFNYSFKLDMETKLNLFADKGFRFIHWCDDWNSGILYSQKDIERFRQIIASCGLKCQDVHGSEAPGIMIGAHDEGAMEQYVKLLGNRIEFCSAIGGDAVAIHPPKEASDYARSLKPIESVRSLCEELGIALAVENCFPDDDKLLAQYFEQYPSRFVGLCFDSGHANVNGNVDDVMKLKGRPRVLHLHDNRGKEDDHQPPFYGTVDWQKVMRWIEQTGYSKPLNFEITHQPRYFEGTPEDYLDYAVRSILKALSSGT